MFKQLVYFLIVGTGGFAMSAHAYIGPGLGAGTLAVIGGLVLSVFLALFAVLWYPLKRLFAGLFGDKKQAERDSKPAKRNTQELEESN